MPANGLVVIPEASAGCVCLFSIASTVVLEPRDDRSSWGIYSAQGARTPVKQIAINLGAPGDRRDDRGRLWLAYPRPKAVGRLEYTFDIQPQLADGGEFFSENEESREIAGAEVPWVYTSGAAGLTRCQLRLRGKNDQPAKYRVTLHFAQHRTDAKSGEGPLNIKLQGTLAAESLDVVGEVGPHAPLIKTFAGIEVQQDLVLELAPSKGGNHIRLPQLVAIELQREE